MRYYFGFFVGKTKEYDKQLEKIGVTKGNIAKYLMKKVHTTDVKVGFCRVSYNLN